MISVAAGGTMRAIQQNRYGGADSLRVARVERPVPGPGEVLLAVHAAGIDRGVWHLMTGLPYLVRLLGFGLRRPKQSIPGMDVAGRVVAIGDGVERFAVGDAVLGIARGAFAEYAVAVSDKLVHKPARLPFAEAAVTTVSGITALQALTDVGRIERGMQVLVIGASGGVGTYAVQLAVALGATVTGVASAAKADFVRSLGAPRVIDYATADYLEGGGRYDLIIDIGGRNSLRRLRHALSREGTLVIVGGEGGNRLTGGIGRQVAGLAMSPFVSQRLTTFISQEHHSHIERLVRFVEAGELSPAVGARVGLDEVSEAMRRLEAGEICGKAAVLVGHGAH